MSGSISLSLDQLLNSLGTPLSGGKIYFYAAGTTTPQSAYQDSDLTIPHANPMVLNSVGYVPQFYLADGFIKIRVTDSNGVEQLAADNILVVGPSSGSGGVSVDATTVFSAGDVKWRYGTGVHTGWVRLAGRSIGSATSGATERANSDTQVLYEYLWAADTNLSVATGRGASAAADFAANKALTLPDARGRGVTALDDMGNSAAGTLTSTYYGTSPIVLGAISTPAQFLQLTQGNLPSVNFSVTATGTGTGSTAAISGNNFAAFTGGNYTLATGGSSIPIIETAGSNVLSVSTTVSTTGTAASGGSSTAISRIPPSILMTLYCKL